MGKRIPHSLVDAIIDQLNEAIDIPYLSEHQERLILELLFSILIENVIKIKIANK